MKLANLQNGIAVVVALSNGVLVVDRISEDGLRVVNTETGQQLVVVLHNDELLFKGGTVDPSETYITHPAIRGTTEEVESDYEDEDEEDCDCDCDEDDCDDDDDYEDDEDDEDDYDEDDYDEDDEDDEDDEIIGIGIMIIGMGTE